MHLSHEGCGGSEDLTPVHMGNTTTVKFGISCILKPRYHRDAVTSWSSVIIVNKIIGKADTWVLSHSHQKPETTFCPLCVCVGVWWSVFTVDVFDHRYCPVTEIHFIRLPANWTLSLSSPHNWMNPDWHCVSPSLKHLWSLVTSCQIDIQVEEDV